MKAGGFTTLECRIFRAGWFRLKIALCRFNPIYSKGMSVAARESQLLLELLKTAERDSLPSLGAAFLVRADEIISDPWAMFAWAGIAKSSRSCLIRPRSRLLNGKFARY
jgi:hypothetical protein